MLWFSLGTLTIQEETRNWAIIAGVFSIIVVVLAGVQVYLAWAERRHRQRVQRQQAYEATQLEALRAELFTLEHQPTPDTSLQEVVCTPLPKGQIANLTIRMILETYVEFLSIRFEGTGDIPRITGLGDWEGIGGAAPPHVEVHLLVNGRYFWRYNSPEHRLAGSRITIAVYYEAHEPFDGELVVGLTSRDGDKETSLLFRCYEESGISSTTG